MGFLICEYVERAGIEPATSALQNSTSRLTRNSAPALSLRPEGRESGDGTLALRTEL